MKFKRVRYSVRGTEQINIYTYILMLDLQRIRYSITAYSELHHKNEYVTSFLPTCTGRVGGTLTSTLLLMKTITGVQLESAPTSMQKESCLNPALQLGLWSPQVLRQKRLQIVFVAIHNYCIVQRLFECTLVEVSIYITVVST